LVRIITLYAFRRYAIAASWLSLSLTIDFSCCAVNQHLQIWDVKAMRCIALLPSGRVVGQLGQHLAIASWGISKIVGDAESTHGW
jgi:hypothetical protein